MAKFQKRDRRLKLEFGNKEYFIDITKDELEKEVGRFSKDVKKDKQDMNSVISEMKKLIKVILGNNAYNEIKQEVYDNKELSFYELFDVCEYMLNEITSYAKEFEENQLKIISKYSNRV